MSQYNVHLHFGNPLSTTYKKMGKLEKRKEKIDDYFEIS